LEMFLFPIRPVKGDKKFDSWQSGKSVRNRKWAGIFVSFIMGFP
jgi:hypothetical protein